MTTWINSQFPRPDSHRQVQRHYGLQDTAKRPCFGDREPGEGPRQVTREEIRGAFRDGWTVREIRASAFETLRYPGAPTFSPGGPRAWLASIVRAADGAGTVS